MPRPGLQEFQHENISAADATWWLLWFWEVTGAVGFVDWVIIERRADLFFVVVKFSKVVCRRINYSLVEPEEGVMSVELHTFVNKQSN